MDPLDELLSSNQEYLHQHRIISDPMLTSASDSRRCIALIARGTITESNLEPIQTICEPLKWAWTQPVLHSSFLIVRDWFAISTAIDNSDWSKLIAFGRTIPSYEINLDRVIPVPCGLILAGTASIDLNSIRNTIRSMGWNVDPRTLVHVTLLRWTDSISISDQRHWLDRICGLPKQTYLRMRVTQLELVEASWCLQPGTIRILSTIDLR